MRDVRVRQALALAIDRRALVRTAFGLDSATRQLLAYTPFLVTPRWSQEEVSRQITGAWDPIARRFVSYGPRALKDARTLLASARYRGAPQVEILVGAPGLQSALAVIKRDWAAVGVNGAEEQPDVLSTPDDCSQKLYRGAFEVYLAPQDGGPDPDDMRGNLDSHFVARQRQCAERLGGANFGGVHDRLIDQAFQQGALTSNPSRRAYWYGRIQDEVSKQAYDIPLFYIPQIVTVNGHLRGITGSPLIGSGAYAWNAWQWRYVP